MIDTMSVFVVSILFMTIAVRIIVPKMLETANAHVKFGLCLGLFLIYNAVMLMVVYWFCTFYGSTLPGELVKCALTGWLVVNISALFCACLFFFTRERRKLTQMDRMKLKDL